MCVHQYPKRLAAKALRHSRGDAIAAENAMFATRNKQIGYALPFPSRSGDVSSWEVPIYVGLTIATLRYVAILRSLVHLAEQCGRV